MGLGEVPEEPLNVALVYRVIFEVLPVAAEDIFLAVRLGVPTVGLPVWGRRPVLEREALNPAILHHLADFF